MNVLSFFVYVLFRKYCYITICAWFGHLLQLSLGVQHTGVHPLLNSSLVRFNLHGTQCYARERDKPVRELCTDESS